MMVLKRDLISILLIFSASTLLLSCPPPDEDEEGTTVEDLDGDGYAGEEGDCDDEDPSVYPGAEEVCDGKDNDCNPDTNEYHDGDEDGFSEICGNDCDDRDPLVNPDAEEVCDGKDNDCNPITDEEGDHDQDGYSYFCEGDCDDEKDSVYPGADEVCEDGIDQDCDGVDPFCDAISLEDAGASFVGENADDYAGQATTSAGDVNGDGYDDILIGAWGNDDGGVDAGKVYLFYSPLYGAIELSTAVVTFVGENAYDYAGSSVSAAGDVNGDGLSDILIGANGNDHGGTDAGRAYLFYSPFYGEYDLSTADATFTGEYIYNYAGEAVSAAGDVNGDGFSDILIGAYLNSEIGAYSGKAYLFHGPLYGSYDLSTADASFLGENANDHAGNSVSSAGDVNGDGYDDILIGAYMNSSGGSYSGKAYLFYGPLSGPMSLSSAGASFAGEASSNYAGNCVSSAGDVNGDGYDDILIGAYTNYEAGGYAGKAYLFYGPLSGSMSLSSADASFTGEGSSNYAGTSLSGAGDTNLDGYGDILVGAPGNGTGGIFAGKVYLLRGPLSGSITLSSADMAFIGESTYDSAGQSVSPAGDADNDGYPDILVGSPYNDEGGQEAGKAYIVYSNTLNR